ncbi:hypothetical protein QF044_003542 [Chryseobacterium sp. W4I1]|nr:hypothetical protein [Chryseobacterium sp. W4I1]
MSYTVPWIVKKLTGKIITEFKCLLSDFFWQKIQNKLQEKNDNKILLK